VARQNRGAVDGSDSLILIEKHPTRGAPEISGWIVGKWHEITVTVS